MIVNRVKKVPVVIQAEAVECGAANLAMIMAYYGKHIPLTKVREECGVSRDGTTAKKIMLAAQKYGLNAKCYKYETDEIMQSGVFPSIIHWNFNHFVVLCGFKGKRAVINDPIRGRITVSQKEFDESFTGVCIELTPGENFKKDGKKGAIADFVKRNISGAKEALALVTLTTVITSLVGIIMPAFTNIFVDKILTGTNSDWLMPLICGLGVVIVAYLIASWINEVYLLKADGKIAVKANAEFMWRVLRLPLRFYSQRMTGDIVNRKEQNENASRTLVTIFAPFMVYPIIMIVFTAVMSRYSVVLTALGAIAVVINLIISWYISKKEADALRVIATVEGKLVGMTIAGIESIESIKASGTEKKFFEKWVGNQANVSKERAKSTNLNAKFMLASTMIEKYESLFVEVSKMPQGIYKKKMSDVLYDIVNNADVRANYMYEEPSDLLGIKALRKIDTKPLNGIDDNKLRSKIKGAWCGRIAGCLLGKPIEGIRTPDLNMLLKESGNYPMRRYIVSSDITESVAEKSKFNLKGDKCWADKIECAPADDDTNYTVMASMLIEQHGKDFTPDDVMDMWMNCQPFNAYCTAERVAWRNYFDGYCPPNTAIYKNPYREWIGAQIRADYFGYINPGNPEMAAEMAWRDASVSHIKNGIYGEMFVAAMLAGAAVTDNPEQAIRIGLGQIPSTSRLYEKVMEIINMHNEGVGVDECCCKIHSMFDENSPHGWCHTISNAMIVAMALLYGNDFSSAVGIAVQAGFDTDCNGATVGSVYGMMNGANSIGKDWMAPINNRLKTNIIGKSEYDIEELVDITLKHINM